MNAPLTEVQSSAPRTGSVAFSKFGSASGSPVVYFHGVPGGTSEASVFDRCAKEHGLSVVCLDRFSVPEAVDEETYFQSLADEIRNIGQGRMVTVVGFSVGAFVALQTCRYLHADVTHLHLVSAAAPLEGGDFLPLMAGKAVFRLARDMPWLFKLLSRSQSLIGKCCPKVLYRMLFGNVSGGDKALCSTPEFQAFASALLIECFSGGLKGYLRDIRAYVRPWSAALVDIKPAVHLWHGNQDTWAPLAMSEFLREQLPAGAELHVIDGASHYSALFAAAPAICRQIAMR